MSKKQDIRSLCNPVPRLSEATQKALLTGEVYKFEDRDRFILSVRRGNFAEVVEVYLLADASLRADARKRDLLKTWDAIEARHGIILEQSTGRRSDRAKDAREMLAQAMEQISRSGKGRKSARNGALSKGAPRYVPTEDEMRVIREEWYSVQNETTDEAVAAIAERLGDRAPGRTWIYKALGSPYAKRKK